MKRLVVYLLRLLPVILMSAMQAQSVVRNDPALDKIVPPSAQVEKVAAGLERSEGPLWDRQGGYLLFSDLNSIKQWAEGRGVTVYHPRTFSGPAPEGVRVGTNGLTFDPEGRLIGCVHGDRRIARWDKNGSLTVLADRFENKRFNSPNDLVSKRNGDVYFTDPPYFPDLNLPDPNKLFQRDMDYSGVYRVAAAGKVELLIKDLVFPNGIAFSPDEKKMYVANSRPKKFWRVYDVKADGALANGKELLDVTTLAEEGVPDGMKVDTAGNLYATGPGGVLVISPQGKHLGTILIPEIASNCAWGDADGKTLYVTARTGLYRIRLNVAGVRP
jgi:gluconolactonase